MNQINYNQKLGGNVYINQNPQRISYQSIGSPIINQQQQMRYLSPQPQFANFSSQQQRLYQYPIVAQQQIIQPQMQVIPQVQIQKNIPQQAIVQQQSNIIQQAPKQIQIQPILPQLPIAQLNFAKKQERKESNISDIQPIMPQQLLDYSGISIQYSQQSPWFYSPRNESSFMMPQDKFISQNNLDVSRKEIQEIRPLDLTNYSNIQSINNSCLKIQSDNPQIVNNINKKSSLPQDVFNSLNNLRNTLNNQNNNNSNQNSNQDAMNVSFSQDRGYQQESSLSYTPQKSLQHSRQPSLIFQQISIPNSQPISANFSTIQGSTFASNILPSHSNNIIESAINQQMSHQRSKSALSPLKSARESSSMKQDYAKYVSPQKTFVSPTRSLISPFVAYNSPVQELTSKTPEGVSPNITGTSGKNNRSQSYMSVTPRQEYSGYKENSIVISQQVPIVGSVSLQYVSKYNPMPHYNNHPSQFHKSPDERSKDAISCVFFKQGQKMPSKIKIKYTPVEELLTKDELQEYQQKHQDLNLIPDEQAQNSQANRLVTSPLKQYNKNDDSSHNHLFQDKRNNNQRSSLNFLTEAIGFLSQKGNQTPDKRAKIEDIMKDMDPINETKY